tara:strand:- start:590 stop:976 length:387 start_codon:yes stop_codon:yes gene_type:complete
MYIGGKHMQKKTVSDKSALFAVSESTLHHIKVAPDSEEYLKVWIKEPTFLQLEKAQAKLININANTSDISLEMDTLFRYLWEAFIEKTEPSLTTIEILRLSPYVGSQIKEILPDPFDMSAGDEGLKVK